MQASGNVGGRVEPAELIALVLALEERDQQDERDRRRLDREIGARFFQRDADGGRAAESDAARTARASGLPLLRAWLAAAPSPALRGRIARVRSTLGLLRGLLFGLGLFLGWAAAAAMLQVEVHAGRINIVLCLGLLVLLPFAMLVVAALGALWAGRRGASDGPGAGGWRRYGLARGAMALLPSGARQDVELLLGRATAHGRLYSSAQRAQLFVWSQTVGLGFSLGALIATLAFVVFTDLAFGWSTTLDVAAESVHRLARVIALPWASIWPEASPSFELVDSTRHFRVSNGQGPADPHIHFVDPILYGGWWPFLVAALTVYGLLPRLLAVGLGARWLGRESARAMALTPGVDRLLDRLVTPLVESQATLPEAEIGHAARGLVPQQTVGQWVEQAGPSAGDSAGAGEPIVIRWAEASDDACLLALFGQPGARVRDAGGRRSLAEDAALVEACRDAAVEADVVLCVRAYEPPVLDVLDYLGDLRRAIGPSRRLAVLLLEGDEDDRLGWRHKLVALGDPGLCVLTIASAESDPASDSRPAGIEYDPEPEAWRSAELAEDA